MKRKVGQECEGPRRSAQGLVVEAYSRGEEGVSQAVGPGLEASQAPRTLSCGLTGRQRLVEWVADVCTQLLQLGEGHATKKRCQGHQFFTDDSGCSANNLLQPFHVGLLRAAKVAHLVEGQHTLDGGLEEELQNLRGDLELLQFPQEEEPLDE